MIDNNTATKSSINLRDLDDVACANVVVSRQIRRLIKKNPSFDNIAIDCWVHGGHYTRFRFRNNQFYWYSEDHEPHLSGLERISAETDCFCNDEWNKIIIFTHRAMCDSIDGVNIEDTPEDLLAFAEAKLQEMLSDAKEDDETEDDCVSKMITSAINENMFNKMTFI